MVWYLVFISLLVTDNVKSSNHICPNVPSFRVVSLVL